METVNAQTLGTEFLRRLRKELTHSEYLAMQAQNRMEANPNVCHSHDYCDANMPMLAAYCAIHGIKENSVDLSDQRILDQMNAAWDYARTAPYGLGR